jgi:hypothetical protein
VTVRRIASLAVLLLLAAPAHAGDERMPPVTDPVVRKECGACHMAFQPGFLPARSWDRMMAGLSDHFGEDVSLPDDQARAIRDYLLANAGDAAGGGRSARYMQWVKPGGTPLRITENPDFLRKHRFAASVWKDPKVMTRSNCLACHRDADLGIYE